MNIRHAQNGNGHGAPHPSAPIPLTLDPRTVLGAKVDIDTGLVELTSRAPLAIVSTVMTVPFGLIDTIFHAILGARLQQAAQQAAQQVAQAHARSHG